MDKTDLPKCSNDNDKQVVNDVQQFGLHVVKVLEQGGTPGWAFSIGLYHNYDQPEIIIIGLNRKLMHSMLNEIANWVKSGQTLQVGTFYSGLLEGYSCTFKEVQPKWIDPFLGYALWFYQKRAFPVLQCLWPDKQNRYPWEATFVDGDLELQPLLYEPDPAKARVVNILATMKIDPD